LAEAGNIDAVGARGAEDLLALGVVKVYRYWLALA